MSNAIVTQEMGLSETMELGTVLAQSGYFQDSKDAAQAIVKIMAGRELGFGPIASMTGINVIKGKVTLSANLIAASVKRSGRYDYRVTHLDNQGCSVEFFEKGQSLGLSEFTMQDAKAAGLTGDNWRKYPKNMCFARAISNGAKWYCPDLSGGPLYTPDELGAEIDGETGEAIDITPQQPPVVMSEPVQVSVAEQQPVTQPAPQSDKQKKEAPLNSAQQKIWDNITQKTDYYKSYWHAKNAVGQPPLNDPANWEQMVADAVDYANNKSDEQKQAASAAVDAAVSELLDEQEPLFPNDTPGQNFYDEDVANDLLK